MPSICGLTCNLCFSWRFGPSFFGVASGDRAEPGSRASLQHRRFPPGASSAKHILRVPHAPLESRKQDIFSKSKNCATAVYTYGAPPPSNSLIQSFITFHLTMPSRLNAPVLTVDVGLIHKVDTRNVENLFSMWMGECPRWNWVHRQRVTCL